MQVGDGNSTSAESEPADKPQKQDDAESGADYDRRNGAVYAAAEALEGLGIVNQPLASIAKREEIIYVQGQEDEPVVLDRHSPVLHLVQMVRDEAHRFAVTFHRKRRQIRDRKTELLEIPGVGERTTKRLLQHFGSLQAVKEADAAALTSVVSRCRQRRFCGIFVATNLRLKRLSFQGRNRTDAMDVGREFRQG